MKNTIDCYKDGEYLTAIELEGMEIPQTVVVDGETYQFDMYRAIYTDCPFTSKQAYLESIGDDVPF